MVRRSTEIFQSLEKIWRKTGLSYIPVNLKKPALRDWNKFNYESGEDVFNALYINYEVTGFSLKTGVASKNIVAIDIDTDDEYILNHFPRSNFSKKGKKGETRFFICEGSALPSYSVEGVGDFLADGKATVMPPSLHPDGVYYHWINQDGEFDESIHKLPKINYDHVKMLFDELTKDKKVKPINSSVGRFTRMNRYISNLVNEGFDDEKFIAEACIQYDKQTNPNNLLFADAEKGCTGSIEENALKWVTGVLKSFNVKKVDSPKAEYSEWGELIEIKGRKINAMPTSLIPFNWHNLIHDGAVANAISYESIFFPMLAALSACFGNKIKIYPYQKNKSWVEVPNLYVAYCALSGKKKNQSISVAFRALRKISEISLENQDNDIKQSKHDAEKNKEEVKRIRNVIKEMVLIGDDNEVKRLEEQISNINCDPDKIREKTFPLVYQTFTPESIIEGCSHHKHGVLIYEEELGTLLDKITEKSGHEIRSILLKGWNGKDVYTKTTKSSGDNYIKEFCLSMVTTCQPSVLDMFCRETKKRDDGLLQRLLIVIDGGKRHEVIDHAFTYEKYEEEYSLFYKAFDLKPCDVYLTVEATDRLVDYLNLVEDLVEDSKTDMQGSFYGKFRGAAVKLAFLLSFIHNKKICTIEKEFIDQAIRIIDYLKSNLDLFLDYKHYARYLASELIGLYNLGVVRNGITAKLLKDKHGMLFKSISSMNDALELLETHNYIKLKDTGGDWIITFNPKIEE